MAKEQKQDKVYLDWAMELKRFQESDLDQRQQARECDRFLLDKDGQWEDGLAKRLDSQHRPRYTFDQTTPAMELIMSEIEDMDFAVNLRPHGGGADKENALLREDLIRTIENNSDATSVYRDACRRVIRRGFDAWMCKAEYADEWSFEQDLCVKKITNAINRVWVSDTCQESDSSDSDVAYVLTSMSPSDYKEQFPNGSGISVDDSDINEWWDQYQPEVIIIADRYYRKKESKEVAQLSNGNVIEVNDKYESVITELSAQGVFEVRRKKVDGFRFYHRRFDGGGYLTEEAPTVFKSNPVVTVYGNYEHLGESSKITYHGAVLKAMDFQRNLNYAMSRDIEEGALSPRSKHWMDKKQAEGHKAQLQSMNVNADPVQFYNHVDGIPPPYKDAGPQPNAHLNTVSQAMMVGLAATTGVNNAMNGQYAGRMSEDALKMQIDRGIGTTRKWVNALVKGIRRTGEILNEAMPEVYDTKRQMSIIGADGSERDVTINDEVMDNETQQMVQLNNLNQGKYKVFSDAGPAFSNRLEAGRDALLAYAAIDPSVITEGGDVLLKTIDAPLVDKIAERKRSKMVRTGEIPAEQLTDEEKEQLELLRQVEGQQPPPTDPAAMLMAQAEMTTAQASQAKAENDRFRLQIEMKKLELEEIKLMQSGYKIGLDEKSQASDIANTRADTMQIMAKTENISADTNSKRLSDLQSITPKVTVVATDLPEQ